MSLRYLAFYSFVILLLAVAILDHSALLGRFWMLDFTGLHYFVMLTPIVRIVINVRKQIAFLVGMRCPSSPYYFVRYLMYEVLILSVHFLFLLILVTFFWLLIMSSSGWRPRPLGLITLMLL